MSDKSLIAEIRKARTDEIDAILEIAGLNNLENWSLQDYIDEIQREDSIFLTAVLDNKIVGFVLARLIMKQNIFSFSLDYLKTNPVAEIEIYNIAVTPTLHRKNIGKQLLKALINTVFEQGDFSKLLIWLEVRQSNLNAAKFYVKNNFDIQYIRKRFYANPIEDAIIMKLEVENIQIS